MRPPDKKSSWVTPLQNKSISVFAQEAARRRRLSIGRVSISGVAAIGVASLPPLRATGVIEASLQLIPATSSEPPRFGEFIICLLVSPERQEDRLADFREKFNTLWVPKFGPTFGRLVYVWWALGSVAAIVRIGVVGAIIDWVRSKLSGQSWRGP